MGVPVVTTDVSALSELVTNEQTGLLVPPSRPAGLAEAIWRMIIDENLRARVIPAARQRVIRDFDNKTLIRELADLFKRAGILCAE